jgi:hypothetical protein
MRVAVNEAVHLAAAPEVVFDFMASEPGFLSFHGYGPIPGLARVEFEHGSYQQVGSASRVTNTDGSTHREEVLECDRPRRFAVRIHSLSSPFRVLVRELDESWEVVREASGSRLHRTFGFTLRSPLFWPLSLVLAHGLFRAAIRRHHRWLMQHFSAVSPTVRRG